MNPVLKVRDVCLSYHTLSGETPALSHISFDLMPGEFLSIVGPSGCGKSTLLNLIAGLLTPEHGSITLGGRPVSSGSAAVGYMLQKDHLLEWRSIYKNILLGLEIRKELTPEKLAHAEALLQTYGLDRFRDARPSQLSGGMRQRIVIAIALASNPEILICDEPTTALDVTIQAQIIALMEELREKLGMSIIIITHDLGVVADMADEIIVMYAGEIVERGTARDIFYHQQHPYTWALLQSVPRIDDEDKTILNTIEGNIPDMIYPPKGCSFCTRCPYAMKICEEEKPKVTHITDEHSVACWLMDPRADRSGVPFGRTDA